MESLDRMYEFLKEEITKKIGVLSSAVNDGEINSFQAYITLSSAVKDIKDTARKLNRYTYYSEFTDKLIKTLYKKLRNKINVLKKKYPYDFKYAAEEIVDWLEDSIPNDFI